MRYRILKTRWEYITAQLSQPADNSALVLFRMVFGFLMAYHCLHFMWSGKLAHNFIDPPFTFSFIGFEWLQPLPGIGMYIYFALMALLALLLMAGAWYRPVSVMLAMMWTAVYLMQKSNYNNHYYLMLLLSWLMCLMPANKAFSVDAKRDPAIRSDTCGRWVYLLFMAQTAIIYFYAAISKLNADWLNGIFIAQQFERLHTRRLTGIFYSSEYFQMLVVYGGFLFDLLIIPLLLWKRSRHYAFLLYCGFHLFNSYTFRIGIFPYLSIALGLFFLSPATLRSRFFPGSIPPVFNQVALVMTDAKKKILFTGIFIYLLIQVWLPLRPAFFPGHVFWTEEGYRMSWKMMLRTKTGKINFKIVDSASGKSWRHDPAEKFAVSHVNWLAICPDISWQYAQRLKRAYADNGYPHVEVYAIDSVRLNNNPPQLLIDTNVNLAAEKWERFGHTRWLLPLKE